MSVNIEKEYDRLFRYCYFHLNNRHLAEDVTQETFLRYLNRNPDITYGASLAYLYTIARNLCIDVYRCRKTEVFTEEDTEILSFEHVEENLDIKYAIAKLAKEQQELLLLRYKEELPVKEIAKILNISRFALYRKEKEALHLLKIILEGGGSYGS